MFVADIMTRDPVTIRQGATLTRALKIMLEREYQQLPVLSDQGHVIGLISQRDCRRILDLPESGSELEALAAINGKHDKLRVGDHMRPAPIVVEPDTPVHEAARLMTTHHVRCLPVMRGETLVGIITTSDLLIAFMRTLRRDEKADHIISSMRGFPST